MREKTQRRLFRTLFLLGCVLPTTLFVAWSLVRMHPAYKHWLLSMAGYSYGLTLECDTIETPRPGEYLLEGLKVTREGVQLASTDKIKLRQEEGGWRFSINEASILADDTQWPSTGSGQLSDWLQGSCENLTAVDQAGEPLGSWQKVHCRIGHQEESSEEPWAEAWTETDNNDQATRLLIHRTDQSAKLTFTTGATPLPLRLIPDFRSQSMASNASFSGTATLDFVDKQERGNAQGIVQLAAVSGEHASWSNAKIELLELNWTDKRIDRFHAHLEAREGSLNRLFVWGLYQMLKCHPEKALQSIWNSTSDDTPIPFDQLACEVELDQNGLSIYGRCGQIDGRRRTGTIAHAVLAEGEDPLLLEPKEKQQSPSNLVRALFPNAEPELPAQPEAQEIAGHLPVQETQDKSVRQ